MNHLRTISGDYERAEVTCIFHHCREKNQKTNILTVFELVPPEQQPSILIGDKSTAYLKRQSIDSNNTLYVTRIVNLSVSDAITKYENAEKGIKLNYENLDANIEVPFDLQQEPPNYFNLLIKSKEEKTLGNILPKRNSNLRVWSKLNTNKDWLRKNDVKLLQQLKILSLEYLGIDLSATPEHVGNIYLCASNPIVRKWNSSLVDGDKLLVSLYPRAGKSVLGSKLVIQEDRSDNNGFTIKQDISNKDLQIKLPYFPDKLDIKIYDSKNQLLEHMFAGFFNLQLTINVQESVLELSVENHGGIEVHSIPKTTTASKTKIGNINLSTAYYLRQARHLRKYEELEARNEFIFFPQDEKSKKKAQKVIGELLNKATERCIILDPYFGFSDLFYVFIIQNISIPIQIISSAMFLKDENNNYSANETPRKGNLLQLILMRFKNPKRKSNAELLSSGLNRFKKNFPGQKIECKVLKGKKSPLHDRYIVIDNDVYLLGSSLNEFGGRVTTLIKVPAPSRMIEQALEWWNAEHCPFLEEFINELK